MTEHTRDVSDQYTSEQVVKQLNAEVAALNEVERARNSPPPATGPSAASVPDATAFKHGTGLPPQRYWRWR